MRKKAISATMLAASALVGQIFASPRISEDITFSRRADGSLATVSYELSGEPAVVTMDVLLNGESAGAAVRSDMSGDVNILVQPGRRSAVLPLTGAISTAANNELTVNIRAWATNCPPDYLVVSLTNITEAAKYYLSADDVPGGVSDSRYKTTHVVMRKIPAANVEWRMGSPSLEIGHNGGMRQDRYDSSTVYTGCEDAHYVRLADDYYLGIYPVTYCQHTNAVGSFAEGIWAADSAYADCRADDMPVAPVQFVSLRSWMHDNDNGCTGDCGVEIYYWPRNGRMIDAAGAKKCAKSTYGGTYTPYLRSWRNNTGFEFDLPTDAQWEFACRAGTGGRTYASDSERTREGEMPANLGDIAWTVENSTNATHGCAVTHPVGKKLPNAFGLYDMLGNVWEFCLDHHAKISGTAEEASVDPDGGDFVNDRTAIRVVRGGSCCSDIRCCRSSMRGYQSPTSLNNTPYAVDTAIGGTVGYRLWLPAHAVR